MVLGQFCNLDNEHKIPIMFQELFTISKTIGCCIENSQLRVVHNSLILDAVKDGEDSYLAEVLSALKEKYK